MSLPNRCAKRLVQNWENGTHGLPTLGYQIILVEVTGVKSFDELCKPIEPMPTAEVLQRLASLVPMFAEAYRELTQLNKQLSGELDPVRLGSFPAGLAASGDPEAPIVSSGLVPTYRDVASGRRPAEPRRPEASDE
ncbi:hypothetical protein [Actinospica sp.]|jgi:hypothetical protein|uniref:hypothetical protein n=1 Tax=Actinospica sp. TaxID=1872142 RepID=UPI002C22BA81|nr:hypothetical protein [Actinospica sp.]HWG25006.1 hypothetical protein [Actinospica sp.]